MFSMSILKMTCPHCNFSYVLPEDKVPFGELTLTCPSCQQAFTYTKPEPGAKLRRPAGGEEILWKDEVSAVLGQKAPEVESSLPKTETLPEEPTPVQASTEEISEPPVVETGRFMGWEPAAVPEAPQVQESEEVSQEAPAADDGSSLRAEPESREKPEEVQKPPEPISKAPEAAQKPSPVKKPVKAVIKEPVTPGRPSAGKKWIIAVAAGCIVAMVAFVVFFKPAVATRVVEIYSTWSGNMISSLTNKKPEQNPEIAEPAPPEVKVPSGPLVVRPPHFREAAGTWKGRLRGDKKTKWTFSFNPASYNVSIKNDSGLWISGTAIYHWDKGSGGESLRVKPNWNVLDIDIAKSSVKEYSGEASLGAFSRYESNLKLCMSRPGKMVEPTETDATGDIQCFELKKVR